MIINYSAGVGARENGDLRQMREAKPEPETTPYIARFGAHETGDLWRSWEAKLEPETTTPYSAGVGARENGELRQMWEAKLEPEAMPLLHCSNRHARDWLFLPDARGEAGARDDDPIQW